MSIELTREVNRLLFNRYGDRCLTNDYILATADALAKIEAAYKKLSRSAEKPETTK